ncbi:hypothetical protein EDB81DRAFT_909517 [Dactylonectria macrodidyma]|uniref:Actin-like ATPase domain-containing protein n=1 Tax=Dactylonectria macrodidyma TaxID=307937 RepID=A0A9P9FQA9_9HYPO|nr:hypothetical protein EDB81DRAFT_909517 [Dactylonectria macrodidyma]
MTPNRALSKPRRCGNEAIKTRSKATEDAIIIGIDFGTTFSGVAWAYSREPDEIELVTDWDAQLNFCSDVEKTPTQIHFGEGGTPKWGYAIPPDKVAIKWFKLLLLDPKDVPNDVYASSQLTQARLLRSALNKDPVDIIGSFLRHLWNHAIDTIKRSVGAELLEECIFHVVITIPAIWPAYCQQRMKRAVELSGIVSKRLCGETTLRFISEPEAAALATMKDLSKKGNTRAGDTIVVCDAGSGTVDLISYVVESVEPLVVKECVKGDGGLCGGVFLDEEFIKLIKRKVTSNAWNELGRAEQQKLLNDGWEHGIKPQFENQPRTWAIDLPDSCGVKSNDLKRRQTLELTTSEIQSVFSPVAYNIEKLVRDQVKAVIEKFSTPPKYIILVGGFGRSRYLFNRLNTRFGHSTVLQSRGSKPWTAICRGAVVHGLTQSGLSSKLQVKIGARVARFSYGVMYVTTWKRGRHLACDKFWCEDRREHRAKDQMEWFLEQGDDINDKHPVYHEFEYLFQNDIDSLETEIYYSQSVPPPSRMDDNVHRLCTIKWNQKFQLDSLPTWTNNVGNVFHILSHEVVMTCDEGTVEFTINHAGKRIAGQNLRVEFD